MARVDTDQIAILTAVRDRLIEGMPLTQSACFVSLYPIPPKYPPGDFFITVAPAGGKFDESIHEGGGERTTAEMASVVVTLFTRLALDRDGRDGVTLLDEVRGILSHKKRVLRLLSGHDLTFNGDQILMNLMCPLEAEAPEALEAERKLSFLKLHFSTDFMWDLTS